MKKKKYTTVNKNEKKYITVKSNEKGMKDKK